MVRGICILLLVALSAAVVCASDLDYPEEYEPEPVAQKVVVKPRYHLGFKIHHRRFSYKGVGYKLGCGKSRFLNLWRRYYGRYGSRTRCFSKLRKLRIIRRRGGGHTSRISYLTYYKRWHGLKLVHGFVYNGIAYRLRCRLQKFYGLWGVCYKSCHNVGRCVRRLLHKRLFVVYKGFGGGHVTTVGGGHGLHRISYNAYLSRYHGFKLHGRRFSYRGKSYKLRCRRRKFYGLWRHYYRRYHAVGRVFSRLYRKKLFVVYRGGSRRVSRRISYKVYMSRYHGFKLRHRRFVYRGKSYKLRCRRRKFYGLWRHYYRRYHAVGRVFSRLYRKKLFVVYRGGRGRLSRRISYKVYLSRYHGFKLRHRRFVYRGKAYKLRCRRRKFYSLWRHYYRRYHAVGPVFGRLFRKKLFVSYRGGRGRMSRRISYKVYLSRYHGFKLRHRRFVYRGKAYKLRCRRRKFYGLWRHYYRRYHAVGPVFGRLYRKKLFAIYRGGSLRVHKRVSYMHYFRKFHGIKLRRHNFIYKGRAYRLKIGRSKFYKMWRHYYRKFHNIGSCFRRLYKRRILVRRGSSRINYVSYYRSHHGFKITGKRVYYNGAAYLLKVKRSIFYRTWYRYYKRYHSVSKIFKVLYGKRFLIRYGGGKVNYVSYYNSHNGWRLEGKRFTYNGDAYILKTPRRNFYRLWYRYYRKYHDIDEIFGQMYDRRMFVPYSGTVVAGPDFGELDEYLDKHKMVADHHVRRIHGTANKHVRRISNVANSHVRKINRQANHHLRRMKGQTNHHINRIKQLVNNHLKKLEQKRKQHLNDVEKQHRRHMIQREVQHKRHISTKQSVNTRHEKFLARAAAHFSDADYLDTYHGFKIIDNRFTYDGKAFELKCSQKRWYTKWCTCYEKEHSVNNCLDSLYNEGLIITNEGANEEEGGPAEGTEVVEEEK